MNRLLGLLALLVLSVLSIIEVIAATRPALVATNGHSSGAKSTALASTHDAGSLDGLLDGVQLDHMIKHGR